MGQKFLVGDVSGHIVARYDADISPAAQIPAGALAVTDADWRDTVDHPGKWLVLDGALTRAPNWPPPPPPAPSPWEPVRIERAPKLAEADIQLNKAEDQGKTTLAASIRTYRQALRDMTKQADPASPSWPTPPW